jgi:hypothetical protein
MRIKIFAIAVVLGTALSSFAGQTSLYASYESVRQALLQSSVSDVRATAKKLAAVARSEKQEAVARRAEALAAAGDVAAAQKEFAAVSDEVIKFRDADKSSARPAIAYCSMAKKSWLQPRGAISNPYVDASMRSCGEFKSN